LLQPLFEFSGAAPAAARRPTQAAHPALRRPLVIANATGCSSIYGGNLPTTPWYAPNPNGRGPAWSNSLFEDNAEFGLGMRVDAGQAGRVRQALLAGCAPDRRRAGRRRWLPTSTTPRRAMRSAQRVASSRISWRRAPSPEARDLLDAGRQAGQEACGSSAATAGPTTSATAASTTCWLSGRNVNVLVLDTEVYSNTGGQASKATPLGAVAKFAAGGKPPARRTWARWP
jgi:pyruvate-ferredoxin/flavodoxin oxidoreductase